MDMFKALIAKILILSKYEIDKSSNNHNENVWNHEQGRKSFAKEVKEIIDNSKMEV